MSRTALVVSAHSADFVWRCGGAIALHAEKGWKVTVICLSYGERGESAKLWRVPGMTLDRVKAWQKINALPGTMLYDRKGEVSGAYDTPATSYMVVLDKTGKVVYTGVGGTQNVDAAVRKAM